MLICSIAYHDIVYDTARNDNEEQSAEWAERSLSAMNISAAKIENCKQQILATKQHNKSVDSDTNILLDADLSILGSIPALYSSYAAQIRKEYSNYPDTLYKAGREKVLRFFLEKEYIYITPHFYQLLEQQARINLENELQSLKQRSI